MIKLNSWTWKNVGLPGETTKELSGQFEIDLYRACLEQDPDNVEVLMEVGNLYTRMGMLREGLAVDEQLVRIRPGEPIFHYNLACSQALMGQVDVAFESLRRAIELGYRNVDYLQRDSDLENLRKDQRFHELGKDLRNKDKRPQQELF